MRSEAIIEAVADRAEAMHDFVRELVDMDSPTEDKALTDAVGAVLQRKAESIGMVCARDRQERFADNLVCRMGPEGPAAGPRVLLVGHFDTVYSAGSVAGRPFRVAGELAYGCGVFDMKGGLAIGLFALEALAAVHGGPPFAVTFIFNSDEEIGSPQSRHVILEEAARHDLVLILEPGRTGPAITVARKGVGIFNISIDGREAHAGAEPEKGINAIVELAHKTLQVQALNDAAAGTTVTPGVVAGGTKPYVVPGHAELAVDCRIATEAERARIEAAMARIADNVTVPGTQACLTGGFHRPPMQPTTRTMDYAALLQLVAAEAGYPLGVGEAGGASDGNLTAALGIPTLDGLGPQGGRAHSPDEFIELASLEAKCRVLACFLDRLAGGSPV